MLRRHYYAIDHRALFLFGFIFYLITPLVVGRADFLQGLPGIALYQKAFDAIPKERITQYTWICLSWLPAFYLGHALFSFIRPYKLSLITHPPSTVSVATQYVGWILLAVLVLFAYLARTSLFGGYASYDVAARGKLSSLLVAFNFFIAYQLVSRQRVSLTLAAGCALTALLLLSMGGRMYVFQTFIVILVFKTSFAKRRWSVWTIGAFAFVALIIAAAAGIWRMGYALDLRKATYSFLAEPVFTWFSTSTFLGNNNIPLIQFPANFLTSFINLVPNSIVNLQRFVITTKQMGFVYENPLGAESAWTTFIINFGVIGSWMFVFATGFVLHALRALSENSRMGAVYYILVCSLMPFQFFRDGFYILNKQLVFNFFLLPGMVLFMLHAWAFTERKLHFS